MSDEAKQINQLLQQVDVGSIKPDYNPEQKGRVKGFFKWVFMLYPGKCEKLKEPETLKNLMRIYSDDILRIKNMNERFSKVKKLKQAGHDKYRFPDDAISKLTGEMQFLNHDYREVYPSHQKATGALEHIKENNSDLTHEEQIERAKGLTELFKK